MHCNNVWHQKVRHGPRAMGALQEVLSACDVEVTTRYTRVYLQTVYLLHQNEDYSIHTEYQGPHHYTRVHTIVAFVKYLYQRE